MEFGLARRGYFILASANPIKFGIAVLAPVLLCTCYTPKDNGIQGCITAALEQPRLYNGVATYSLGEGAMETAYANLRGKWRLASRKTYPAASLTKPLVAHATKLHLAATRKSLDTPVDLLFPENLTERSNSITLRHLLQHSSGLGLLDGRDPLWNTDSHGNAQINCRAAVDITLNNPTRFPPGLKTEYSNAGYCVLGEILLYQKSGQINHELRKVLLSGLGAAGGWRGTMQELHGGLKRTLPLSLLPPPQATLPDGSWYSFGWRFWPDRQSGAPWTHTGRLPGFLAVALTDGEERLLVAHFDGDPADYLASASRFGREAWRCLDGKLQAASH